ncbi:MAG: hypothetical protein M3483_00385 [Gemmatimonadota bacterium]|nr:hypothetical protein [Gemmatimonadota bacterium]
MTKSAPTPSAAPTGLHPRTITPVFPLLLFETMRDMDRPEEILEGEELSASLPRRFGLSDVVFSQIHRFREEVRRKRPQGEAEIENLIKLVIRRPDAERIFEEAGKRLARRAWEERSPFLRGSVRVMPPTLALRAASRAARRLLNQVTGNASYQINTRQGSIRITGSLTARADPAGSACAFYGGVLAEVMERYTRRHYRASHSGCEARGAAECEWTLLVKS